MKPTWNYIQYVDAKPVRWVLSHSTNKKNNSNSNDDNDDDNIYIIIDSNIITMTTIVMIDGRE